MRRWEEAVRRSVPAAERLSAAQLRNNSTFLRLLAEVLAGKQSVATAFLEISRQHASSRFQERYDLRELILEYRLLRRIIIEEVQPALQSSGRSMSMAEQAALHFGIDAMLQHCIGAFVDLQHDRLHAAAAKAAATAEQAKDAVAIATERTRAAVAVATEQAKFAAATTSEQAKDAAWAVAEQAAAAAWAAAEQATAAALATSEQAKLAVAIATEQARAATAVATEQDKVAAAATSEQARDVATAMSEEATAVALATSEQARDVATAMSEEATAVALATSDQARNAASALSDQAQAAAAAASQIKDHFLAVLSHELRNPLTPVLATVSLLQLDERFDKETQAHLEVIRRNAELEARLIDDLLDVTRISRGKVELDRYPSELATILRHAVEVCQPDIEARSLKFELAIKDPPHIVDADAGRLQQVFWNIIKNAVKFTPRDGRVGVHCWRDEQQVVVEVRDSGLGIDPEALPRIFNAFEQVETSVTRQFGGLGLGLAISKALVEMHGGTITAQSPGKGHGATFRVTLPLVAAPGDNTAPTSAPSASKPVPARAIRPLRVLLVEDHGDTAHVLALILKSAGHTVIRAGDMASALELAGADSSLDLLLSDVGLPDGSGVELMKELRRHGNPLPGIALSGYGQEEDIRRSLEAGYSHHVLKPVTAQRLLSLVSAAP